MKSRNFPAKKTARRIRASAGNFRPFNDAELLQIDAARAVRTKKRRGNHA